MKASIGVLASSRTWAKAADGLKCYVNICLHDPMLMFCLKLASYTQKAWATKIF